MRISDWSSDVCSSDLIAADPARPWDDTTFSEYCTDGFLTRLGGKPHFSRMVRSGRYKLNYYHGHPAQLFDLEADPKEQADLASDPKDRKSTRRNSSH